MDLRTMARVGSNSVTQVRLVHGYGKHPLLDSIHSRLLAGRLTMSVTIPAWQHTGETTSLSSAPSHRAVRSFTRSSPSHLAPLRLFPSGPRSLRPKQRPALTTSYTSACPAI